MNERTGVRSDLSDCDLAVMPPDGTEDPAHRGEFLIEQWEWGIVVWSAWVESWDDVFERLDALDDVRVLVKM